MSLDQKKNLFKWISILEGLSLLVLVFLAMPLKYLMGMPQMVQKVGMIHGILFIAYVLGALFLSGAMEWKKRELLVIVACSVVPFGPFYAEKRYL